MRPPGRNIRTSPTTASSNSITSSNTGSSLGQGSRTSARLPGNSSIYPKDVRPDFLQDDSFFDTFDPQAALQAVMMWGQTKAMIEANTLKAKKAEKSDDMKLNTDIKVVKVEAGEDDATKVFHPQRFQMRPPVVDLQKVWSLYPTHWPETYYSVYLTDVGLDNQLGHKQLELLHDRRKPIKVQYFAPINANVGRSGFKTTNLRSCDDGTTDLVKKDEWAKVVTVTELMLSLDNLVAAWAVFWPGERSMVTIRRVVSRAKEFAAAVSSTETRLKLLQSFINKALEINQRKACQGDVPLVFKELWDMAKEYLENVSDFVSVPQQAQQGSRGNGNSAGTSDQVSRPSRQQGGARVGAGNGALDHMKSLLKGQKYRGVDFCLEFNLKGERGNPRCTDRRCKLAHNCAFVPRGESRACGGSHSKIDHFEVKKEK